MDEADDLGEERPGPAGRVEDLDAVDGNGGRGEGVFNAETRRRRGRRVFLAFSAPLRLCVGNIRVRAGRQGDPGRIGIVLEPSYNNWPAFLRKVGHREAQLFRVGWFADYPDAENFLQLFHGPNASPGPNRSNYTNPVFDELYREAVRESDPARRLDLYRRMQEIIREDCPWIFLHHRCETALVHDRLRNFRMHDFPYGMEKHYRLLPP